MYRYVYVCVCVSVLFSFWLATYSKSEGLYVRCQRSKHPNATFAYYQFDIILFMIKKRKQQSRETYNWVEWCGTSNSDSFWTGHVLNIELYILDSTIGSVFSSFDTVDVYSIQNRPPHKKYPLGKSTLN